MDLKAYTYSFPFKKPFKTSAQTFESREGIILELVDEELVSLGEAAPLPGFSPESLSEVKTQLRANSDHINEVLSADLSLQSLLDFYRKQNIVPSLQFALDTLTVDYLSQKASKPAQNFLFDNPKKAVKVNGVVSIKNSDEASQEVRRLVSEGYGTLKMKVGVAFQEEHEILKEIRRKYPKLTIRLDANKAWNLQGAIKNLSKLDELEIEYCEEPLSDPSIQNLKKLNAYTGIPIALDESLLTYKDPEAAAPHISVMVIKPMVFGSLSKLFATNRIANDHDNKVIYTTSLESGIGRTMTAILAAGLDNSNSAHGLATGSLLKMDVWHDGTYINNGSVCLPDRSELGEKYHSNHKYLELDRIDL